MKKTLIQTFNYFNYDYYRLNLNDSLDDIIKNVEKDLINNPTYDCKTSRELMAILWQLQRKQEIKKLSDSPEFNHFINEITKNNNYSVIGDFIVCKKFIPCTAIKTLTNFCVLENDMTEKLTSMGYGINQYKIEKAKTIKNIYCCGKHPNLNKENGSFCMGSELLDLPVSKTNLEIIEESLSQFNLVSTFISDKELSSILEVIE